MSTHNICFYVELEKIIPKLSSNTLPNKSSDCIYFSYCYHRYPMYFDTLTPNHTSPKLRTGP